MTDWTVMLKRGDGVEFRVVTADAVDWSDDRESLDFTDFQAGLDAILILNSLLEKSKAEQLSKEEAESLIRKLIRTAGRITVASFERESVLGYFKGKRANVNVVVTQRD